MIKTTLNLQQTHLVKFAHILSIFVKNWGYANANQETELETQACINNNTWK